MYIANVTTGKDFFNGSSRAVKSIQLNASVKIHADEKAQMRADGWERVDYADGSRGHWAHKFDQALLDQLVGLKAEQDAARAAKKARKAEPKSEPKPKAEPKAKATRITLDMLTPEQIRGLSREALEKLILG